MTFLAGFKPTFWEFTVIKRSFIDFFTLTLQDCHFFWQFTALQRVLHVRKILMIFIFNRFSKFYEHPSSKASFSLAQLLSESCSPFPPKNAKTAFQPGLLL